MNKDASSSSRSRQSPSQEYVSPGSDSKSSKTPGSTQKRASRAGTRSVTTLSAAQLERKRANDREAQRAIRQRTKDHIEGLERRVSELTMSNETREKLMLAAQQRNRELEEENAFLRGRLGEKPVEYNAAAPASSPQAHLTSLNTRAPSTSPGRSIPLAPTHPSSQHAEQWRQHSTFAAPGVPTSTAFMADATQAGSLPTAASWRTQEMSGEAQSSMEQSSRAFQTSGNANDRSSWVASNPSYGYQVRAGERPPSYPGTAQSLPYSPASQAPQFQTMTASAAASAPVASSFHGAGVSPHGDYPALPMGTQTSYSATQASGFADQQHHQQHSGYQVSAGQVPPATDFPGSRGGLAAPGYNTSAGSQHFMPSQGGTAHSLQMTYREGTGQHQYSYDG